MQQSIQLSNICYNRFNLSIKSKTFTPTFSTSKTSFKNRSVHMKNNYNEQIVVAANTLIYLSIMYYSYRVHNKHSIDMEILEKNIQMRKKKNLRYYENKNKK